MDEMEPKMIEYGFKKSFSKQKFIKQKDKDFTIAYSLSVYDKFDLNKNVSGVIVEPSLYVHFRPIEKIYFTITTRKLNFITDLRTIGNLLADIIANPSGNYLIHNKSLLLFNYSEKDFLPTANILVKYFEDFALPYFSINATVNGLNRILNHDLDYISVHCCNNEVERSLRGIIAAKLFADKNIDLLISEHTKKIKKIWNDNYEIELKRLIEMLPAINSIK